MVTLQETLKEYFNVYYSEMDMQYHNGRQADETVPLIEATQAIGKDLMLLIGEDVPMTGLRPPEEEDFFMTRNKLKAELRLKLKEYTRGTKDGMITMYSDDLKTFFSEVQVKYIEKHYIKKQDLEKDIEPAKPKEKL